ncbi:arginine repressor [Vibrio sp. MACH09]|uniref:arginine repressor n=1 Tax=unclassified Vibrio TaxID=2614977 RepID=UPI0014938276|nr:MULTISPECIES: arginine repressor [unclassified Vibrio]NOI65365.1 arginine repressor [Vibrio sp. 99-8-1]GLO60655.1 arginine repressor [Vibrio sp. MACH09]
MSKNTQSDEIAKTVKEIILNETVHSQAQLISMLEQQGFGKLHQSMMSRILTKLGAVRVLDSDHHLFYQIPHELDMPSTKTNIEQMVNDIDWNHAFIIIKTTPSAAELVARLVDSVRYNLGIMGVVSGDDTIFITPQTGVNPQQLSEKLNRFFNLTIPK